MRIPSFLTVLCAAALVVHTASVRAGDDAKTREALRNALSQPGTTTTAEPAAATTVAAQEGFSNVPAVGDSDSAARMRQALRGALATPAPAPEPAPAKPARPAKSKPQKPAQPEPVVAQPEQPAQPAPTHAPEPAPAPTPAPEPAVTPATAPAQPVFAEPIPSAVPASKEARLAELLRQYKADAISAEDYHNKRAAILAEP